MTETAAIGVPVQQGLQPYHYILANYLMTNRARWDPTESTVCGWTCPHYAAREGRGMGPGQLEGPQAPHSWPAGSRGTRVGSVNTSAVMSIHTLAVMPIHSAQSANFVQIIGIPPPGLGTLRQFRGSRHETTLVINQPSEWHNSCFLVNSLLSHNTHAIS